ncbi:MAG TPA: GNAT family N-acetyltransferase [Gemmatimonadaceae bacterium]
MPVRVLSFIGHEFSDYGSFLMNGDREAVCGAFLNHLKNRPDWHQLRLHNMPSTNGDFDRVSRLGAGLGYELDAAESIGNRCFYVRTEGDFDEYFKKLSHNLRHDVAKRQRRLNEAGGFELKFTGEVPLTDLLDAVATIHAKRQHDLERSSFFERGAQADFVREILAVYAQKGWLDYAVMTIGGRVAAYRVGFRYRGVLYDWNTAFDPEYNSFSVGKVLLYLCIKKAFERQDVQEFNFMRGESEYKQKYTSDFRWNSNFVSRRPGSLYARGVSIAEEVWRTGKKRWFREQILPPAQ